MKKAISLLTLALVMVSSIPLPTLAAGVVRDVVINEVAWSGSVDAANDEWLELYNNTNAPVDLTGWKILDDVTSEYALSGVIPANGYFLIEDAEAVTSVVADQVIPLSFANTGDSLVLVDELGTVIDTVNGTGGAWFAGNSVTAATMERVDPTADGDVATNWASNTAGDGATASLGSAILGTPKALNSTTTLPTAVSLSLSNATPAPGDTVTLTMSAANVADLYSYGFEIGYDPTVVTFASAIKGGFLGANGSVSTAFQSALENGVDGKLLVAEARLMDTPLGVSGGGALFTATFNVVGAAGASTNFTILPASFLANSTNDIITSFAGSSLAVALGVVEPVTNLNVAEALNRYELQLDWTASVSGANSYKVFRKDQIGNFVLVDTVNSLTALDVDNLVPNHTYEYQVVAVKNGQESVGVLASGHETRGLTGDNDRSDRVDGRDLQRLANHFADVLTDPNFDKKIDTNYDALIDGIDLLDITANFGLTF
ncbi:hypothetical protein COV81_04445 [Candidatus Peregrinibacteria bacterium CG11_big_fil_rev_8_21_14_0_20_41_10]|nr:MAG: hypothetical protein COV81_04445 [Candidatus Peregrinibacteria bacterium CG11_big_fil_rev_8_21_14_0_20_41_10]PIZ73265.1 MAG: hypothetical protein COY06_05680 [Candidatus Peregrinibacteria bacterium CG_4_10_14_0_2_um_filter_41_8]PJC38224.1 MAG: hypothetical protein CO045_01420 [Candidatus Peregrinibacteria bacterium CG_4_9_14_0_2_um_filter_41_14]